MVSSHIMSAPLRLVFVSRPFVSPARLVFFFSSLVPPVVPFLASPHHPVPLVPSCRYRFPAPRCVLSSRHACRLSCRVPHFVPRPVLAGRLCVPLPRAVHRLALCLSSLCPLILFLLAAVSFAHAHAHSSCLTRRIELTKTARFSACRLRVSSRCVRAAMAIWE